MNCKQVQFSFVICTLLWWGREERVGKWQKTKQHIQKLSYCTNQRRDEILLRSKQNEHRLSQ